MKVWDAVKALSQNEFGTALTLLRQPFPDSTAATASPMKEKINMLRDILVWHLSEHTVPELISDAYSNIEFARVQQMLGDPTDLNQLLQSTDLLASASADAAGFVAVNPRWAKYVPFALDQERVMKGTQVVQFLERQHYDVAETAT